jgi:hypothetical protein
MLLTSGYCTALTKLSIMTKENTQDKNFDNTGDNPVENQNQEINLDELSQDDLKELLLKEKKARKDFELFAKKEKSKRKELEEKIALIEEKGDKGGDNQNKQDENKKVEANFITKEDLFFDKKGLTDNEIKERILALNKTGMELEEAYGILKPQIDKLNEQKKSSQVNSDMLNSDANGTSVEFMSDDTFIEAFKAGRIEQTDENVAKFAKATAKKAGLY